MSVFHAVVDGNGTKPLRLASLPVLIMLHVNTIGVGVTVMLRLDVADCGVGIVESVTVTATAAVPTELDGGVPVIAPVELLIASPLGRLLALYV
jgi:hypothetical protein